MSEIRKVPNPSNIKGHKIPTIPTVVWNSCMFSPSSAPNRERISRCQESYFSITFCWTWRREKGGRRRGRKEKGEEKKRKRKGGGSRKEGERETKGKGHRQRERERREVNSRRGEGRANHITTYIEIFSLVPWEGIKPGTERNGTERNRK